MDAGVATAPRAQPEVSVVVPTRRRPALLRRCVRALLDQRTGHTYEVVVVDDEPGAPSGLTDLPADPRLRVVAAGGRGVSAARNRGVAEARAALVAFTDDDTVPDPGWIDAIVGAAAAEPGAVAFDGPIDVTPFDPLYFHAPIARPGGLCGANVAYRRWVLDALTGFDERFQGWMPEDIEFAERARALGPVVHVPAMRVEHPPRRVSVRELVARGATVEGEWLLFRKHPHLSRWRLPLRWAPAVAWLRRWGARCVDPQVVRASPVRAVRLVSITVGTTVVALHTAFRRWPGPS